MFEIYPYFTNDGSVGLFSPDADDIYHSTYGALTEAYEKFILPSNLYELFKTKKEIKVLDICFGIGYNTKCLLNEIIKILYNYTIGSNNTAYNDKLYTNNIFPKFFIHAIDNDKKISLLAPFFKSYKKIKNNKLDFKNTKIEKLLSTKTINNYKLNEEINIILLYKLIELIDDDTKKILTNKKYQKYFDKFVVDLCSFYKNWGYKTTLYGVLNRFLHNIYYKYISLRNKKAISTLKLLDFNFDIDFTDAREAVSNDDNLYDLIFLDAFTPVKCPCLWTLDFFKELYNHLNDDGMILTYSNSAQVRNAFMQAGFYLGKIFSESQNKFTGTVAVKNKSFIKYELSDYDLGLLKTKAGIFYRDENLSLTNDQILARHKIDVENSILESSSHFINRYKKENNHA